MATKITLRQKKIKGNRQSLYLDFYPPIPNPKTGEPTRREFLKMFVYTPVKILERKTKTGIKKTPLYNFDPSENNKCIIHNEDILKRAEKIKQQRQNALDKPEIYTEYERDILRAKEKKKQLEERSFLDYFTHLANKRKSSNYDNWISALKHLQKYGKGEIKFGELNEAYCEGFKEHLFAAKSNRSKDEKLSNNTVLSYFNKFKAALKQAYKDGFLINDLNAKVDPVKPAETHRNFLTMEELNTLAKTECAVPILKQAGLFSALTGLRFVDIEQLTWRELEYIEGNGYFIKYKQEKTDGIEFLPISKQAYDLLGKPKEPNEKVFQGLIYSAWLNNQLLIWLLNAGIKKKITFHCFRHTFATLQLSKGTDIYTVSKMLGHRDLKTTQVYAKIIDKTKRAAADRIQLDL